MSGPPDRLGILRQWVEKAEEDLVAATRLLSVDERCPFSVIAFHAQQCAEKYIKALLVERQIPFPKIHDIGELLDLLPAGTRPSLEGALQERLTYYATTGRYPGDPVPLIREDAEAAVAAACEVREAVRRFLPKEALEGFV